MMRAASPGLVRLWSALVVLLSSGTVLGQEVDAQRPGSALVPSTDRRIAADCPGPVSTTFPAPGSQTVAAGHRRPGPAAVTPAGGRFLLHARCRPGPGIARRPGL